MISRDATLQTSHPPWSYAQLQQPAARSFILCPMDISWPFITGPRVSAVRSNLSLTVFRAPGVCLTQGTKPGAIWPRLNRARRNSPAADSDAREALVPGHNYRIAATSGSNDTREATVYSCAYFIARQATVLPSKVSASSVCLGYREDACSQALPGRQPPASLFPLKANEAPSNGNKSRGAAACFSKHRPCGSMALAPRGLDKELTQVMLELHLPHFFQPLYQC